jgi:hypothetical protein
MFETKRVTREEQTLIIDDAELVGVMPSGADKSSYIAQFKMNRDGVETHLHVYLHRSHIEAIKNAHVLTAPQLRAVHTKAAKAEEASKEAPKPQREIIEIPKDTPLTIQGKITVLEPGPSEQVNWKDPKLKTPPKRQQESRRLSNREVEELMHQVFRWFKRWRHNKGRNRSNSSLDHYLHCHLPSQFGITVEVAQGIYRADKYRSITTGYRNQWGIFIHNLKKSGIEDQLPGYLRKKYCA